MPITLWSVLLSHLRMPVGPSWCSGCSPATWARSARTVIGLPLRGGRAVRGGTWRSGTWRSGSGRAVGCRGILLGQPRLVLRRRQGDHVEEHDRVVEAAELRALGPEDAGPGRAQLELVEHPGLGVAGEIELRDVKAVHHVPGAQGDEGGLARRHDQARA